MQLRKLRTSVAQGAASNELFAALVWYRPLSMAWTSAGGGACWLSAGALEPPPPNMPPIAWPMEEPTATPLTGVSIGHGVKPWMRALTLQSKPSGRTGRVWRSPAGLGRAAGPAEGHGQQSSEAGVAAAEGGMQSGPEPGLLACWERCGQA